MANGYPVRPEDLVLPECAHCGSRRFCEAQGGLRCEDCEALQRDPFRVA